MKNKKLWFVGLLIAFSLAYVAYRLNPETPEGAAYQAKYGIQTPAHTPEEAKNERLSLRAAIGAASLYRAMRNPKSFQLDEVWYVDDESICYTYSAQNGFGGMNSEYAVLLPTSKNLIKNTTIWNKRCAGKPVYDVTENAKGMMNGFAQGKQIF